METILSALDPQRSIPLADASAAAAARRYGSDMARRAGLDETAAGRVANVIMEAGTNILKYGAEGEILLRTLSAGDVSGVEILALDRGPGMADLSYHMMDGTSSARSFGIGLGAMQRVADEFDIYTQPGKGTAIRMAIWERPGAEEAAHWQIGAVCQPYPGEEAIGDAWGVCSVANCLSVLVADGLGHGPEAARASQAATAELARAPEVPPHALLNQVHAALRGTRGAAVAIARLDNLKDQAAFAGIGNIAACVVDGHERRQLVSHNGIVGSNVRKVQEFALPWNDESIFIFHSDGLGTRWNLEQYAGLSACHPGLIAGVLYRDFSRKRDDVTVLAIRKNRG